MMPQVAVEMKNIKDNGFFERPARLEPKNFIMVVDSVTREVVGKVINFNESGMQLLMHNEMELNQILELTLVIKNSQSEKQYIKVIAELLWVKKVAAQESVLGGFYLSSKNFKSKFRLNQLIKSLH